MSEAKTPNKHCGLHVIMFHDNGRTSRSQLVEQKTAVKPVKTRHEAIAMVSRGCRRASMREAPLWCQVQVSYRCGLPNDALSE